ncbi:MAG: hypothetical protein JNK02_16130 [Planctomycetes bacterium]|nr:hypothetical protein [Planctomycetota bacterium]
MAASKHRFLAVVALVVVALAGGTLYLARASRTPADDAIDMGEGPGKQPGIREVSANSTREPVSSSDSDIGVKSLEPKSLEAALDPWEVDDDLAGIEHEKDRRVARRRILTHYLHEFRRALSVGVEHVDPLGLEAKQLQLVSIATILDLSGREIEPPTKYDVETIKKAHGADHFFALNDRVYVFKKGEFLEYDRIVELQLARMKIKPEPGVPTGPLQLGPDYYAELESRALEALVPLYSH